MLVVTQVLSLLQSLALGLLTLSGRITILDVLILQALQGVINAFDTPARQAFVVEMVDDPADLANAIALNSSLVNGSRIIGPAVGGAIISGRRRGLVLHRRCRLVCRRDRVARRDARAAVPSSR